MPLDSQFILDGAAPPGQGLFIRFGLDPETRRLRAQFTTGGCESTIPLLEGSDARVVVLALREMALTIESVFTHHHVEHMRIEHDRRELAKQVLSLYRELEQGR